MKAAKLVEIRHFELTEEERPQIRKPTDVLVRVKAVGICGTDLHIFKEGRADVQLPRVMGHELAGIVEEVGSEVQFLSPGDHVALDPVFACGECETCRKGFPNVCSKVCCFGVQMEGGYQDYIVVDQKQLYRFSSSISFEIAALAEPFSIAANILSRANATQNDSMLIIGSGAIGLSLLQAAKAIGMRVMVADVIDKKLSLAAHMGADQVVNSKTGDLKTAAEAFTENGFDIVIDAVGITPLFQQSLQFAAPRARVMCIGFDARPAEIPPVLITKKELSIIGSRMNCHQFPTVMQWLEDGKINAEYMISKRYSIDEIQQAFESTIADTEGSVKTMILFD